MAANGFVALSGALASLDYLTGRSTVLDAEWTAKTEGGDPAPKTTYLMLLSQVVTDAQTTMSALTPMEVTGTGYARQPVPWAATDSGSRTVTNSDLIQFGPFGDPAGLAQVVTGAALVTRMTSPPGAPAGLCLMAWNLASGLTTQQNQALQIATGALTLTLAVS